jgi:hypothetical protein
MKKVIPPNSILPHLLIYMSTSATAAFSSCDLDPVVGRGGRVPDMYKCARVE